MWDEPTLVSFLIVFLLYATYQPLRFSIEDPERQARYAAVFAIIGRRLRAAELHGRAPGASRSSHPRVLGTTDGDMPGSMALTFLVALVGMALLFVTLCKYEMASKHAVDAAARPAPPARRRGGAPRPPRPALGGAPAASA